MRLRDALRGGGVTRSLKAPSNRSSSFSSNPWIAHVQAYRASQGCSYAEAMQGARKTYRSAALQAVVAKHCKEPNAQTEALIKELVQNEKAAESERKEHRRNAEKDREERKLREQEMITSLIPTIQAQASTDSNKIADLLVEFLKLGGFERVSEIRLSNSVQVSLVVEFLSLNSIEAYKVVYMKFERGEQTKRCKTASNAFGVLRRRLHSGGKGDCSLSSNSDAV